MEMKESKSSKHFWISLVKSGVRIGAGMALCKVSLFAGILLIVAEILGIAEEL